jgi:SAM-dependent methyltransferase
MKTSLVDRAQLERFFLLAGALNAGLVDALAAEEPAPAARVAAAAGADPRATFLVLEALVAEGIVERAYGAAGTDGAPGAGDPGGRAGLAAEGGPEAAATDACYRLTAEGREHLVGDGPQMERYGLLHQAGKMRGWMELPEVIRTGRPGPRDPARKDRSVMVAAMGERDPEILDEIVNRCLSYAGRVRTMIDVGGAVGHMARHFARSGVRATLFDREGVIPRAREFLGADAEHIALIGGDFTQGLPPGPFDLAYFGNVHHIYSPAVAARVTREAHDILTPGGVIAIQDFVWGRSRRAALFAVNMLQATEEGGVWTEAQFRGWLADSGFDEVEVLDLHTSEAQLILGRKADDL